ncbi:MAG: VOC family protein [Deltaproteobacteria bacterium]|nr:VOC family protein [Deltaproteobacteria bacterium]
MANHVCHFEIPADDIKALEGFYGNVFGWTFERVPGEFEYHVLKTSEGNLSGGMMLRQDPHQGPVNYVCVESIDEALEKAHAGGATTVVAKSAVPQMGWFAVLHDPQKNPFGLWQEDPNAA